MARKTPENWSDRLKPVDAPQAKAPESPPANEPKMVGLSDLLDQAELASLRIRAKELEMALYQAKAKICEFELEKIIAANKKSPWGDTK